MSLIPWGHLLLFEYRGGYQSTLVDIFSTLGVFSLLSHGTEHPHNTEHPHGTEHTLYKVRFTFIELMSYLSFNNEEL